MAGSRCGCSRYLQRTSRDLPEAKNDTEAMNVALPGCFVRDDTWNWTIGATLYAGETLGAIQEAIPTGADAIIKVVGFAVTADVIYFYPSPDQQSTVA